MKDKKVNLGKLNLNKMSISSLQSVKGGRMELEDDSSYVSWCNCASINTRFTRIPNCC